MTVGENIRKFRKARGLTQKQLGELCGIKEANVRKYELNKANPKVETINRIASALNVSTIDIMGLEYFDSVTDLDNIRSEISHLEQFENLFITLYGQDEYDSFIKYSLLTKKAAEKVKEYIKDLYVNPQNVINTSDD